MEVQLLPVATTISRRGNRDVELLCISYFRDGFPYKSIVALVQLVHGLNCSLSTMKRLLRKHNLISS